jgi:hypothetical protein
VIYESELTLIAIEDVVLIGCRFTLSLLSCFHRIGNLARTSWFYLFAQRAGCLLFVGFLV